MPDQTSVRFASTLIPSKTPFARRCAKIPHHPGRARCATLRPSHRDRAGETVHWSSTSLHTSSAVEPWIRSVDQFPAIGQSQIRVMLSESLKGVYLALLAQRPAATRARARSAFWSRSRHRHLIREGRHARCRRPLQPAKPKQCYDDDALIELVKANRVYSAGATKAPTRRLEKFPEAAKTAVPQSSRPEKPAAAAVGGVRRRRVHAVHRR